jgi:acyl-CoA thioesterase
LTKLNFTQTRDLLHGIPFDSLIGIKLIRVHEDGLTIGCEMRPDLRNAAGGLHGGVTATLADVAAGVALARHIGRLRSVATVEMKINYLRPVREGRIAARARLVRVGKTLSTVRVDVVDGAKQPVAAALLTYIILNPT